jgi:hypothetical protein
MSKPHSNRPDPDDDCPVPPAPPLRPDPPWDQESGSAPHEWRSALAHALSLLAREIRETREHRKIEFDWFKSHVGLATKADLEKVEHNIMSAIGDWAAKVGPKLGKIQTGLDTVQALVKQLQNSPGAITAEDQATLDTIEKQVDDIATDADSVPATPPPA